MITFSDYLNEKWNNKLDQLMDKGSVKELKKLLSDRKKISIEKSDIQPGDNSDIFNRELNDGTIFLYRKNWYFEDFNGGTTCTIFKIGPGLESFEYHDITSATGRAITKGAKNVFVIIGEKKVKKHPWDGKPGDPYEAKERVLKRYDAGDKFYDRKIYSTATVFVTPEQRVKAIKNLIPELMKTIMKCTDDMLNKVKAGKEDVSLRRQMDRTRWALSAFSNLIGYFNTNSNYDAGQNFAEKYQEASKMIKG